jgi:hypothetical protein
MSRFLVCQPVKPTHFVIAHPQRPSNLVFAGRLFFELMKKNAIYIVYLFNISENIL